MSARLRLVGWRVQPIVMVDDGENLTPLSIEPQDIPASAWQAFKDGGDEQGIAELRRQVEASDQSTEGKQRTL